jgi:GNAT superfamily N-acetyltransferase
LNTGLEIKLLLHFPHELDQPRAEANCCCAGVQPVNASVQMRPASQADHSHLEEIRQVAFAPVFASFRSILGDDIYHLAQAREDAAQGPFLRSLLEPDSGWEVHVADLAGRVVGFVSLQVNRETLVGEIGLNAVHPDVAGQGIGSSMFEFALARMRAVGMRVATVATGGDASHAPARRAYEKAGFDVEIPSVWMCRKL